MVPQSLSLPQESEAASKLFFSFPDNAELSHGKCEFKTEEDLVKYVAAILGAGSDSKSLRGFVMRKGKYQKVDKSGNPLLTIGDPILDIISDDDGRIVIGGEPIDLTTTEFSSPRCRSGGLASIDLSRHSDALSKSQLLSAARGEGDFTLIEASERVLSFASKNPSQQDFFPSPGGHLRFKAWKKKYVFYWSMGAEIETWGASSRLRESKADTSIRSLPKSVLWSRQTATPIPMMIAWMNTSGA